MADFINFEAEAEVVEVEDGKEHDEVSNISEDSFIDDQEVGADINFYRQFANVENDLDQVLTEAHNEALEDIEQFDEISNLCDGSDSEIQIDEFQSSEIDITKFKETLFPRVDEAQEKVENQFCKAILYALRFDKNGAKDVCSKKDFEKVIDKNLNEQIDRPEKFKFYIELQIFLNMCYEINAILSKFGYFLRVFEFKNKFCHLTMKDKTKQKIVRQLSSCLIEKYSVLQSFQSNITKSKENCLNQLILFVSQHKHIEIEPLCHFSEDISKACSSLHSKGKKDLSRAHKVYQCFYCNKFFVAEPR